MSTTEINNTTTTNVTEDTINKQKDEIKEEEGDIPPFICPNWGSKPVSSVYLEVIKNGVVKETIDISNQEYSVFGRNSGVSTVVLDHPSVSRRHAALVYHGQNNRFYLIDLQSSSGSFVNSEKIKPNQPVSVKEGFIISFGSSSKQFILKGTNSNNSNNNSNSSSNSKQTKNKNEPKQVKCRHLLVKHSGSRNPSSWREDKITRSKEEAIKILQDYRARILSNVYKFEELAQKYSDCSSAKRGGMLDTFTRGRMQKSFEDASFQLEVGELSEIVDTDSGVHIIERLE
ncbi:hypothetical protein DLAC_00345 [Tieghemostelium lacteum]|uniref:Peptidyl-prolyl cis-trans isomerase n=1 Tax=Tieghemostelium lacteum TaxID=361077 RepID=A0A152A9R6_TIELA|nr:hypothetical protein DLAC_00345 [Tieghemostelium lacteum]|eukprot:KYR02871.1 hypothetical protein DLAC_00345 [Tieghemostelium lacteum]